MDRAELGGAAEPAQAVAHATLFGAFHLYAADGEEIAIANRRARLLLAMLCLEAGQPLERDYLSKLFWPGRFEAHAKASLRQCLLYLGKLLAPLGADMLDATRNTVALRPGAILSDLDRLEAALAQGDHEAAATQLAAIGAKPILDRMDFGDLFNRWHVRGCSDAEQRLRTAVMAALAQAGDAGAQTRLRAAWQTRSQESPRVAAMAAPDGKTRIAVLPFRSTSAGAGASGGQDYFADGMVDELITAFGQVPQLLVAGRTSSFHFRGSALALPEIAKALGVSHLVEGAIQRQGEQVRIHVHLIDGATGFEAWAQRFDGTLDRIFALQEEVAQAVTAAIGARLGIAMQPPLVSGMTHSKEAYDLYLQARALSAKLFGDGVLDTAVALLDQAVAIDPHFAEAWLLQAEVHQLIAIYTACLDRPAASTRMAECVEKALALKPGLGQAYSLLGLHQLCRNDFVGALDLAFKGYDLEPNNPAVAMRLGSYFMFCGRTEEGMKYIEEAIAQDPVDGRKFMLRSTGQLNRGDIGAAIAAGQRAVDLGFPSMYLAVATAASGQHDLAVEQYMQTRLLLNKSLFPPAGTTPMPPEIMDAYWLVAAKGVCSGKAKDREHYCRTLDYLYLTMYDNGDPAIALPTVFMGYTEMLYKTVGERVSPANMGCLMSIWTDLTLARQIWQDPGFIPFAEHIGMAAAWDKYGWPDLLPAPDRPD